MADNSYGIEIKPASKNGWFTPEESNAYYKARYARDGVTVHWWGDGTGASNHDNIVNYMNDQAAKGVKSVNYVASDNKITMCVSPDDVAWCSNTGNPTTISIEFQPTLGAEGYKKAGWLIDQLEQRYSKTLKLYKHSDWVQTDCPGAIDLNRIRQEANKWKSGVYDSNQTIPQGGDEMASSTFINQVFQLALGRDADSGALQHYGSGQYSEPEFVLNDVFNSQERKTRLSQQTQAQQSTATTIATLQQQVADLQKMASDNTAHGTEATAAQKKAEAALKELKDALSVLN